MRNPDLLPAVATNRNAERLLQTDSSTHRGASAVHIFNLSLLQSVHVSLDLMRQTPSVQQVKKKKKNRTSERGAGCPTSFNFASPHCGPSSDSWRCARMSPRDDGRSVVVPRPPCGPDGWRAQHSYSCVSSAGQNCDFEVHWRNSGKGWLLIDGASKANRRKAFCFL